MSSKSNQSDSIRIEHLSKLYRLNAHQGSLRDAFSQIATGWLNSENNDNKAQPLWALKDVSLTVSQGEAWGVIGPNGAGKTTLLKILSRITRPTEGEIEINGRLAALIELGAGFHPDLTGRENIFLSGSILRLARNEIKQKFDSIVAFSGLERFVDTPVKRYSSGMYVRLAFSVAAHTDPEILLVDEVLAVGDADFRQKCIKRIDELRQKGVSIIFVSHNLFQVRAVCQRGIFLSAGQIHTMGPIAEVINAYESRTRELERLESARSTPNIEVGTGSKELRITMIRVLDRVGRSKTEFDMNEQVEIRVHFVAHHRFQSVNFRAQIIRTDGMVCTVMRSKDLSIKVGDLDGEGYISINISGFQLISGVYSVLVELRDSTDLVQLATNQSAPFEVIGPLLSRKGINGVFLPHISRVTIVHELEPLSELEVLSKREEM